MGQRCLPPNPRAVSRGLATPSCNDCHPLLAFSPPRRITRTRHGFSYSLYSLLTAPLLWSWIMLPLRLSLHFFSLIFKFVLNIILIFFECHPNNWNSANCCEEMHGRRPNRWFLLVILSANSYFLASLQPTARFHGMRDGSLYSTTILLLMYTTIYSYSHVLRGSILSRDIHSSQSATHSPVPFMVGDPPRCSDGALGAPSPRMAAAAARPKSPAAAQSCGATLISAGRWVS